MPKTRPISLYPLRFDQVLKKLLESHPLNLKPRRAKKVASKR
jgi:hypothetical protein